LSTLFSFSLFTILFLEFRITLFFLEFRFSLFPTETLKPKKQGKCYNYKTLKNSRNHHTKKRPAKEEESADGQIPDPYGKWENATTTTHFSKKRFWKMGKC